MFLRINLITNWGKFCTCCCLGENFALVPNYVAGHRGWFVNLTILFASLIQPAGLRLLTTATAMAWFGHVYLLMSLNCNNDTDNYSHFKMLTNELELRLLIPNSRHFTSQ